MSIQAGAELCQAQVKLKLELNLELKLKLVATSPGGWWVGGGWTKSKFMLFSTQIEVVVELGNILRIQISTEIN